MVTGLVVTSPHRMARERRGDHAGDVADRLGTHRPRGLILILNLAWSDLLFWDGRAESLEEQALGPIAAPAEMNQDLKSLVGTIQVIGGYGELFARAYRRHQPAPSLLPQQKQSS